MPQLASKTSLQNGAFVVGPVLGRGGFGITYKGGDVALRRVVAIKEYFPHGAARDGKNLVPPPSIAAKHAENSARFLNEARTLARFNHSGIVRVYNVFEENNTAYMVMEFLEGDTLLQWLKNSGGKLPLDEVLSVARQVGGALEEVHRAGLLHRDIKPENVIVSGVQSTQRRATLLDFGTARALTSDAGPMTQLVTPGYAPLEQYARRMQFTPATDVYAFCATLYHLLSGNMPSPATDRAIEDDLLDITLLCPGIPAQMARALMRGLSMQMKARQQSVGELLVGFDRQSTPSLAPLPEPIIAAPVIPQLLPKESVAAPEEFSSVAFKLHQRLERHAFGVNAVAFAPDAKHLLSAGQDKRIYIWNWRMGGISGRLAGHELAVLCAVWSPDGAWIASGSIDTNVLIWDAATRSITNKLEGHREGVRTIAFSPVDKVLLSGGDELRLWDLRTMRLMLKWPGPVSRIAFSPDGRSFASADAQGEVKVWDAKNWNLITHWRAHNGGVRGLSWSPDGHTLATCGSDRLAKVWDAQGNLKATMQGHNGPVSAVAFCPNGQWLATASDDLTVRVWQADSGAFLRRHNKHRSAVTSVDWAQSETPGVFLLASGSHDKTINVCRVSLATGP